MDETYPNWFWPFASSIDTPLKPPKIVHHIMLGSKVGWADGPSLDGRESGASFVDEKGVRHFLFEEYPDLSIHDFHEKFGLTEAS
ncbi:hypothetical protein HDU67_007537 [Dinochytrium kinnereticum]|nr:hypothetical protein HDU67_007537 [Dinochytrium kinnereticum]